MDHKRRSDRSPKNGAGRLARPDLRLRLRKRLRESHIVSGRSSVSLEVVAPPYRPPDRFSCCDSLSFDFQIILGRQEARPFRLQHLLCGGRVPTGLSTGFDESPSRDCRHTTRLGNLVVLLGLANGRLQGDFQ
jgi:hypothetical protein